jgi:N-acetylmuramoyl-L-alanine amidase
MTLAEILPRLSDRQVLALTAWAEARSKPVLVGNVIKWVPAGIHSRLAVMDVITNRAAKGYRGKTVKEVCLFPGQFSCWSPKGGKENHEALLEMAHRALRLSSKGPSFPIERTSMLYEETEYLARFAIEKLIVDITNGATHYYSPLSMVPRGTVPPWARGKTPVAEVEGHLFFKDIA